MTLANSIQFLDSYARAEHGTVRKNKLACSLIYLVSIQQMKYHSNAQLGLLKQGNGMISYITKSDRTTP